MNWAQFVSDNAPLILSVVSGTGAAAVLLQEILRFKTDNVARPDLALPSQLSSGPIVSIQRQSVLDRITLLNRNLIQCPRCSMIDYANTRFCNRCGMPMQANGEPETGIIQDFQAHYLGQNGSTRMFGVLANVDPKTRVGVLIGIQNRERQERINEARD